MGCSNPDNMTDQEYYALAVGDQVVVTITHVGYGSCPPTWERGTVLIVHSPSFQGGWLFVVEGDTRTHWMNCFPMCKLEVWAGQLLTA